MARSNLYPLSSFELYVDTEAQVPGKDGASAALIAQFDQMLRGTSVFVQETGAIYAKPKSGAYTADGNRIVLVSSGSSGVDGVDGIFTNSASLVAVGNLVAKGINPNNVVLADASDGTLPAFGVVVDVIDTLTCVVREFGEATVTGGGAFTPGATVYLSETAGAATTTAPATAGAVVQKIGVAKSATEVILGATPTFSASVYAQNGTLAQPSWSFASDPRTGAYRFGASTIGFSLGGVLAALMQTDSFGYIGTDTATITDTNVLVLNHTSSNTTAAGFGTAIALQVQKPNGDLATMGKVSGGIAEATPAAEQGRVDIVPAFAGTLASVGLRTRAPSDATLLVVGLEVLPATAGASGVSIAPYGAANGSLALRAGGLTGSVKVRTFADDATVFAVQNVSSGVWGIAATSARTTNQTSNGIVGQFQINAGAGAAGVAISNDRVQANATIILTPTSIDATAGRYAVTAVSAGTFTVTTNANHAANTVYNYIVVNPAA